ncbi:MAG: Arm DNA-binding domain-containing protein [Daejeonella sp.]
MKTTFSLLFYLKKPKNYTGGLMPVYVRITADGQRSETTTGRECEPVQWNSAAGRLKGTKEEVKSLNAYLDDLQTKVYNAHRILSEADELITAKTIRDKFLSKAGKSRYLIEIFKDHNKKVEEYEFYLRSERRTCSFKTYAIYKKLENQ